VKICHIITGLNSGGAEAVLYRLCTASWPAHYSHVVVSLSDRGVYADKLEKEGIPVHCVGLTNSPSSILNIFRLYRLLRKISPDVVQTWMYHADFIGGLMARLAGVRAIVWGIHNSSLEPGKSKKSTILIAKLCAHLSSLIPRRIISCSEAAARIHQELGYRADRFVIIPNGYPTEKFIPDHDARTRLRAELNLHDNQPVLGMVARYDAQKDHANLLEALAKSNTHSPRWVILLVGAGMTSANREITALAEQLGIKDRLCLLGQRQDIPAIMNAIDIHILSSAYGEAFPNVLNEAMACGTPCITTNLGDAAHIVGDTGWVVPPRDPQALASALQSAMTELATDPAAWHRRQQRCRQRIVDNFSLARMAARYQNVWESVA
jgi:glycosyltransferase involved in cell wall biosynthesis